MKTGISALEGRFLPFAFLFLLIALHGTTATGSTVVAWGSNSQGQTNVPPDLTNAIGIAGGTTLSVVLKSDGTVVAWGENFQSQTNVPPGLSNVVAVAASGYHALALKNDGTVVAWGDNSSGQSTVPAGLNSALAVAAGAIHSLALLNNGTVTGWVIASPSLGVPAGLSNVVAIATGAGHSLALKSDGKVVAWGSGPQSIVPAGLSNVIAIAAGGNTSLALKNSGTLVAWGSQTSLPAGLTNVVAIAAGLNHRMALRADGTVVAWGIGSQTNVPVGLSNVVTIAAGGNHCLAIVNDSGPVIVRQPTSAGAIAGSSTLFSVTAAGAPLLLYQWQFNGTNIDFATNAWLILTNVQLVDEGSYRVVVSNVNDSVLSSEAALNVIGDLGEALNSTNLLWTTPTTPPWFPETTITHDGIAAASSGALTYPQQAKLQTTVIGPGTLTFWWMALGFNGTRYFAFYINGTNQATLTPSGWQQKTYFLTAGTNVLQWTFNKSDTLCCATFAGYLDEVTFTSSNTPAFVITPPTDKAVPAGTNVTFTVTAGGTPPFTYQWRSAETNIFGATNASFSMFNVQTNNAGSYSVTVSNASGGDISSNAMLVVNPSAPWIATNPVSREMVRGGQVTFRVSARGSDPIRYQWRFNGGDLAGETAASLVLNNVQTNDTGTYSVTVSNAYDGLISFDVSLNIVPTLIVAWGNDFQGISTVPLGLTNIAAISAGDFHSLALRTNGTVSVWGWDAFDVLDIPAGLSNVTAVAAGYTHSLALKTDGTVIGWGFSIDPGATVPTGLTNITAVDAGDMFSMALKLDGTVIAWGNNSSGQTNVPFDLTNVVAIAAGGFHGLALKQDGKVVAWGNLSGVTNVPPSLNSVVAVAAGQNFSLALSAGGTMLSWGYGPGQTNVPPDVTNAVAISAGYLHSLALKADGRVVAWGSNSSGETNVPNWLTNVVAISAGESFSLALLNDGSPYVTRQPLSRRVLAGETLILNAGVMGASPLHLQWQFNGTNIDGATGASLLLTNVPLAAAGNYRCTATNAFGNAETLPAALTVLRSTPQFDVASGLKWTSAGFTLQLSGLSGHGDIVVYASSNLVNWESILTNPPIVGTLQFVDSTVTNRPMRFYRTEEK